MNSFFVAPIPKELTKVKFFLFQQSNIIHPVPTFVSDRLSDGINQNDRNSLSPDICEAELMSSRKLICWN